MTPTQYRMARAALGWTTRQVSAAAGVPVSAVNAFESGQTDPCRAMSAIRSALQSRGIVFVDDDGSGAGIRFKEAERSKFEPCPGSGSSPSDVVENTDAGTKPRATTPNDRCD